MRRGTPEETEDDAAPATNATLAEPTSAPAGGGDQQSEIIEKLDAGTRKIAQSMGIPFPALIAILIGEFPPVTWPDSGELNIHAANGRSPSNQSIQTPPNSTHTALQTVQTQPCTQHKHNHTKRTHSPTNNTKVEYSKQSMYCHQMVRLDITIDPAQ